MESGKPDKIAMQPEERRAVGVMALIAVIRMFGLFSLLPVLSPYAGDLADATPLLVGLAVGAYGLTQAGLQVPLGALSDRVGRLPVIVGGLLVFAAGSIVAGTAETIYGLIAGRLLQGAGAISATLTALISDATRVEVRTRSMAVFGVGVGAAFMIAVVAGPLIAGAFGVRSLFFIAAALALFAAVLLRLVRHVPRPAAARSWNITPAFRADLLRLDFYVFLLHAIMTAMMVALPVLLGARLNMPLADQGLMYLGAFVVSLAIALPLILRDQHRGRARLIGIAVALILCAQLMLTFLGFDTLPVFLALVVYFGGFTFLEAGLPARLSVLAAEELRGASLGVFSSAQFFGAFVGGLIGGRFLGHGRPGDVFFVCALMAGIWLALQGFGRFRRENAAGN